MIPQETVQVHDYVCRLLHANARPPGAKSRDAFNAVGTQRQEP
jgi:hypothetical protein